MTLGEKIKTRRKELKLTLENVAQATGVARSTVQKWESGQIESMRQSKIQLLANCLRVPVSFLLTDNDAINEEAEKDKLLEEARSIPGMHLMFAALKGCTEEEIQEAVAIITALKEARDKNKK